MKNLRRIPVPGFAPEDVLFDVKGHIYTGLKESNAIVRIDPGSDAAEVVARPGGKPLGLEWLPDGRLLVCNAELGLQTVDLETGAVAPYPVKGVDIHLCNNAHVLADGTILVSDSSSKFPLEEYPKDLIQNTCSGRLLRIMPDGNAEVLLEGLSFANGVVCLPSENTVLVAATGTCQISRVDLATGQSTLFAEVDGHPDNMSIGSDGRIWVAVPSSKNNTLAQVHALPLILRKLISNLPEFLQPKPQNCCWVHVFNPDGTLHKKFAGDAQIYFLVTGVREQNGHVALGSIEQDAIAVFETDG